MMSRGTPTIWPATSATNTASPSAMSCWVAARPAMKPRVGSAGQGRDESGPLTHDLLRSGRPGARIARLDPQKMSPPPREQIDEQDEQHGHHAAAHEGHPFPEVTELLLPSHRTLLERQRAVRHPPILRQLLAL